MDYGIAQGLERATGNLAATGMKLMEFQANKQIAADRMALEREKFGMEKDIHLVNKNILDEKLKEEKYQNTFLDMEDTLAQLKLNSPLVREYAVSKMAPFLQDSDVKNPDGTPRKGFVRRHGLEVLKQISADPKAQIEIDVLKAQDIQNAINKLAENLPEDAEATDPKVDKILKQQAQLKIERDALLNNVRDAREKLYPEATVVVPEGGTLVNKNTGETVARGSNKTPRSLTDNELIAAALKGDKEATAILNKKQEMRNENARESRSQPQQTQFIDPASGNPLIYDRATNTYKVATVEGAGGAAPRMVNPSAGEREKGAQLETIRDQLNRIKSEYKSRYVGLIAGRIGAVTQFTDADEAAFRQVILDVKDSLLRARSGAQINEQEYKRLSKLVPDFNDSEKMFEGKMKSFETTFNTIVKEREKAQRKGGVYIRKDNTQKLPEGLKAGW